MDLKIGAWVVLSEDGLWWDPFNGEAAFARKSDAVSAVSNAMMDARRTPLIERLGPQNYMYHIKNCDSGKFDREYQILKVTKENFDELEKLTQEE